MERDYWSTIKIIKVTTIGLAVVVSTPVVIAHEDEYLSDPPYDIVMTDPTMIGLTCPRTDFTGVDMRAFHNRTDESGSISGVDITMEFLDLSFHCPGENPNFQFYDYRFFLSPSNHDEAQILLTLNHQMEVVSLTIYTRTGDQSASVSCKGAECAQVNVSADTITVPSLSFRLLQPPWAEAWFTSRMWTCALGLDQCLAHPLVAQYADKVPNMGKTTFYEGG